MQDTTKRYQCRHIFTDGHRCGSPCLRHEEFCYYHHTTRRPVENPGDRRRRQAHFDIPLPEDRSAIQCSIGEVLLRIARNEIDPKRAGLLLYGLQIASLNLPPVPKKSTRDTYPVEEIVIDPQLGTLAPRIEVGKAQVPEERLSVVARLLRDTDPRLDEIPGAPRPASGTWDSTASPGRPRIAGAPALENAAEATQEILPTLQATEAPSAPIPTYPRSTPYSTGKGKDEFTYATLNRVLRRIPHSQNVEVLEPTLQNIDQLVIPIRVRGPQEEPILQHEVPRIADEPLDHLAVIEVDPHPKPGHDRRMLMKMQGPMAKVSIEGLDEEHGLRILRGNLFDLLCVQKLKSNRIEGILRIVPQQLIDRSKLAHLREASNCPIFITNNDPVRTG